MKQHSGNSNNNGGDDDNVNGYKEMCWALKIHKDSHAIKKSSSGSTASTLGSSMPRATMVPKQQRAPVIIYTHSPKVIHTNPKDFMSLVQKLTGMSQSDQPADHNVASNYNKVRTRESHLRNTGCHNPCQNNKYETMVNPDTTSTNNNNDDNESSISVITTDHENCSKGNIRGDVIQGQLGSYLGTPLFDSMSTSPTSPLVSNLPFYDTSNSSSDLLSYGSDMLLYDYTGF